MHSVMRSGSPSNNPKMKIARPQRQCPRSCDKKQSPGRSIAGATTSANKTMGTGMAATTTRSALFWCFLMCVFARLCGVWLEFTHVWTMSDDRLSSSADSTFPSKVSIVEGGISLYSQQQNAHSCPPPRRRQLVAEKSTTTKTGAITPSSSTTSTTTATPSAVLCAMAKDEEAYLDEWVNYHLAIGFETIYIYDNSDNNELRQWGKAKAAAVQKADSRADATPVCRSSLGDHTLPQHHDEEIPPPSRVQVVPWAGEARQFDAYWDCGNRSAHGTSITNIQESNDKEHEGGSQVEPATWAAFWDIDEFFVLHQHDRVTDFLKEYCASGSLAISWIIMGGTTSVASGDGTTASQQQQEHRLVYSPVPVTKRFLYRDVSEEGLTNSRHIKSIVKMSDLKLIEEDGSGKIAAFDHPHLVKLRKGVAQRDTNGRAFSGPRNRDGPRNVAVLYHYNSKSRKEYIRKRTRGRAPLPKNHTSNNDLLQHAISIMAQKASDDGQISQNVTLFDDTVWKAVKRYVPEYAIYDQLSIIPL